MRSFILFVAAALLITGVGSRANAESVRYVYDAAGRLVSATYVDLGRTVFYEYDLAGNILNRTVGASDCNGEPLPCDDGDPCTIDQCDPSLGCQSSFLPGPNCTTTTLGNAVCGDFSGDGIVTATDALGALRAAVGTDSCPLSICDVNADGAVRATDALAILRAAVGLGGALNCTP